MKPVDVLIVGGGPAGLATAIAARRKGLSATVVDGAGPPIDKTCGEGLLPGAVFALRSLGISFDSHLGFPFTGIQFSDEKWCAGARFAYGHGFGLRRDLLHQLLIERAEAAGASLRWGARVSAIQHDGLWIDGQFHRCTWLVGADGQRSAVRKFAGLDRSGRAASLRFGFRRHFALAPWSDVVEVHWGEHVQLFVTPVGAEEISVVALTSDPRMRLDRALERFPHIAARLRRARELRRETGAATLFSRAHRVTRGNIALAGDASCSLDAISGQGLTLAFQEAIALADATANGNLAAYSAEHARITKNPCRMTRLLLMMHSNSSFRRAALRMLSRYPWLFAKLTSMHSGGGSSRADAADPQFDGEAARVAGRLCEHS